MTALLRERAQEEDASSLAISARALRVGWWWLVALTMAALALGWCIAWRGGAIDSARMVSLSWRGLVGLLSLRLLIAWFYPIPSLPAAFPSPREHPMRYWHIVPQALPVSLCEALIERAEELPWTEERHTVATLDQPLVELGAALEAEVHRHLYASLLPRVESLYQLPPGSLGLREGFVIKYPSTQQNHLPIHRDASILTLSIALNERAAYEGGGTYFPCIDRTIQLKSAGDLLVHCGKIRHGGRHVLRGCRYLLVCFLDCSACPGFDHAEITTWDSATPDDFSVMASIYR